MAKKLSKGKEKKLQRRAETEKAQQLKAFVTQLNMADDLLQAYPAFTKYDRRGLQAELRYYHGGDRLPQAVQDWAFGLTKAHMQTLYEACPNWGWSDADKQRELADPAARFICVFESAAAAAPAAPPPAAAAAAAATAVPAAATAVPAAPRPAPAESDENVAPEASGGAQPAGGKAVAAAGPAAAAVAASEERLAPLAFMHFRFEEEAGEAVLYLYEVQVDARAQGKGLGKFLLQLLELVGRRSGVARLVLTVFHGNTAARQLYAKLGYVTDEDSPGAVDPGSTATYDILTKWLKPRAA